MLELKVLDGDTEVVLQFEHSLLSLSKWESRHKKPFLVEEGQTFEDMIDYYADMLLNDVDPMLIYRMTPKQLDQVKDYIDAPHTASSVPQQPNQAHVPKEIITSELIYYWMVSLNIPFEAESWNLSRLMMLIQITSYKAQPPKERSQADMYAKFREANAARKKKYNTNG